MKRNGLIVLLVAFVADRVAARARRLAAAIRLAQLGVAKRQARRRACRRRSNHSARLHGAPRRCLAGAGNRHGEPAHADQLPRRAGRARSTRSRSWAQRSGAHAGRLRGYSQGDGASFVPDSPFDAGEQRDGARRDRRGRGAPGRSPSASASTPHIRRRASPAFPNPPAAPADYQSFYTMPGVQAPVLTRHRARPRSRGGRHPHDQRARPGPVRAADLHAAGPARLVRQALRRAKRRRTSTSRPTKAGAS